MQLTVSPTLAPSGSPSLLPTSSQSPVLLAMPDAKMDEVTCQLGLWQVRGMLQTNFRGFL
jgi:hypothetical protein